MMQAQLGMVERMLGKTYERENCSAARALEHFGERWSLLIIRDAVFRGRRQFAEFQRSLGLASNGLATRLDAFVAAGIMERRTYSSHQDHYTSTC
jgi:DNA-binding HxlR family transcriptional regulator